MTDLALRTAPRRGSRLSNYRWIPLVIVAAFLVVVAVNGGLIYFAASSWPGLTTDHAYNEGLAYNRVIDETEKEAKLGWKVGIRFTPMAGGGGTIAIVARDATGAALSDLSFGGELVRPVEQLANVPLTFAAQGNGLYTAVIHPPRAGQWDIYLVAHRGEIAWHGGQRVLVPGS